MFKLSILFLLVATVVSCAPKYGDAPDDSVDPKAIPLTPSQVAGSHVATCQPISGGVYGNDVNGMSLYRSVTLNTDGTYHLSIFLFTGSVCQMGGTQIFNYTQWGVYALSLVTTSPANATQVMYTTTSNSLTVYGGSGIGSTWAGYFNTYCPGGPTNFNTSGTSSRSESGITCSHLSNPSFSFPTFPADGSIFYDVILLNSTTNPTFFNTSTPVSIFMMGQFASYPTNANYRFAF